MQYLDDLLGEVRVVHAENGRLDVPRCRETLDLNLNVVGSSLVQDSQHFLLLVRDRLISVRKTTRLKE